MLDCVENDHLNADFEAFIWSIGFPVHLEQHLGYKANLNSSVCDAAPYFSDLSTEIIFNVIHLIKGVRTISRVSSHRDQLSFGDSADNLFHLITPLSSPQILTKESTEFFQDRKRQRSRTAGAYSKGTLFENTTQLDTVIVIWAQEANDYLKLTAELPPNFQIAIIVSPQPLTAAMYTIRVISLVSSDDGVGPLLDGMILNRPSLAFTVRHTVMKYSKQAMISKPAYKKPYCELTLEPRADVITLKSFAIIIRDNLVNSYLDYFNKDKCHHQQLKVITISCPPYNSLNIAHHFICEAPIMNAWLGH